MAVYPLGGNVGKDLNLQYLADVAGPIAQKVKLPAAPTRI